MLWSRRAAVSARKAKVIFAFPPSTVAPRPKKSRDGSRDSGDVVCCSVRCPQRNAKSAAERRPLCAETAHTTASVRRHFTLRNADKCLSILRSRVDCAEFLLKEGLRECPIENRI